MQTVIANSSRATNLTGFAATIPGRILIGLGATVVVAAAAHVAIPLPFTPVPLTLQPLAVLGLPGRRRDGTSCIQPNGSWWSCAVGWPDRRLFDGLSAGGRRRWRTDARASHTHATFCGCVCSGQSRDGVAISLWSGLVHAVRPPLAKRNVGRSGCSLSAGGVRQSNRRSRGL
jgi:hypothetical protein